MIGGIAELQTGVWFPGGSTSGEMVALGEAAERAGVDSVWAAEGLMGRDAFVSLACLAKCTTRVKLGTGVVNPYIRHPAQLAAAFATLDEASNGRMICGVGIGARDQLARLGFDVSRPLGAAREMIEFLRKLLARETLAIQGRKFQADNVRLAFRPARDGIPIYLAATGPKMCALAGELADGIYLPYGVPEVLARAIRNSRERRDDQRPFDIACQILMSVDDELDAARAHVRAAIGFILTEPNGESVLESNGIDPKYAEAIRSALAGGGVREMVAAVSDEIVDRLTIVGDREACLAKLRAILDCGVTHPQVSLLGEDPAAVLETLQALKRDGPSFDVPGSEESR